MNYEKFNAEKFITKYKEKEILFKKLSLLDKLKMNSVLVLLDTRLQNEFVRWNLSLMEKRLECVDKNKKDLLLLINLDGINDNTFDKIVQIDLSIPIYTIKAVLNVVDGLSDFSVRGCVKDIQKLRKDKRVNLCRNIWESIWWDTDTGKLSKEEIKKRRGKKLDDFHARANKVDTIKENYKENIMYFVDTKEAYRSLDLLLAKSNNSSDRKIDSTVIELLSNSHFREHMYINNTKVFPVEYINHLTNKYSSQLSINDLTILNELRYLHLGGDFSHKSNRGNQIYSRLPNDVLFTGKCLSVLWKLSRLTYKEYKEDITEEQKVINRRRLEELLERKIIIEKELKVYYDNKTLILDSINSYGVSSKKEDTINTLTSLDNELRNIVPGSSLTFLYKKRLLTTEYVDSIEIKSKQRLNKIDTELQKYKKNIN